MSDQNKRPLEGIRVLDLTLALAGPYATLILGGLGAEVIRIEATGGTDIARTNPPYVGREGLNFGEMKPDDVSVTILNRARNKKSVTLNLKSGEGRRLFFELVKKSDVVFENMSDGTAARLGIDYATLCEVNPAIVYASINGLGDPSLYPGLKGMDVIVQALSGLMGATGAPDGPPMRSGLPIADLVTPLFAVIGVLSALQHRSRTGEGQQVRVSMLDCMASLVAEESFDAFHAGGYRIRTGNHIDRAAPFGIYPTAEGHVAIIGIQDEWLRGICEAVGQPELIDDPRFSKRGPRLRHARELDAIIEAWTRQHPTAHVVAELFDRRRVPCARVRDPLEVLADPRLRDSGAVVELEHPELGPIGATGMGLPIRFSSCAAQFDRPAMLLGAANGEVYGGLLGIPDEDLERLRASGVI